MADPAVAVEHRRHRLGHVDALLHCVHDEFALRGAQVNVVQRGTHHPGAVPRRREPLGAEGVDDRLGGALRLVVGAAQLSSRRDGSSDRTPAPRPTGPPGRPHHQGTPGRRRRRDPTPIRRRPPRRALGRHIHRATAPPRQWSRSDPTGNRVGPERGTGPAAGAAARPTRLVRIHRVEGSATPGPPAVHATLTHRGSTRRSWRRLLGATHLARHGQLATTARHRFSGRSGSPIRPRLAVDDRALAIAEVRPDHIDRRRRGERDGPLLGHSRISCDHAVRPFETPPHDRPAEPAARRRAKDASSAGGCHSATTSPVARAERDRSVADVNARGPWTTTTSAHFDSARTAPRAAKGARPERPPGRPAPGPRAAREPTPRCAPRGHAATANGAAPSPPGGAQRHRCRR